MTPHRYDLPNRRELPPRRPLVTQKIRIPCRTLYISIHDDPAPAEVFLRVKGTQCTGEVIALYDVLARLASLALQHGASVETVGELLLGVQFEPAGPVSEHPRLKHCTSLPDLLGRHLLIEYAGREDLVHVTAVGARS